ncbi:S26A5-like protein [Mya arenaria]|uniref:S26A5-like protein n=1 Tax=Mya arenaria TaxID=6604 RepID=A0ABY7G0B1_MYAAR|nr:S26A5-like protein [Mya arenaria]
MDAQAQEEVDKLIQQQEQNGRPKILVDRSAFSQKNFDENFEAGQRPSPTVRQVVRKKLSKCMCSGDCMAYGMLTTLPPVYGLYMSFFPVLLYFLFGSSKHVSMVNDTNGSASGIESEEGAMSQDELDIRLQFAMSVTFMVGVVQLLMGVFRLGFITVYLSDPLISGFTTGAACHVFTSQIKHIFAIKTARYAGAFKLIYTYKEFFMRLGDTNYVTVIISVICIAILYSVSRFINQNPKLKPKMFMPVPIELIVVVLGTVISYAIKLETAHNELVAYGISTIVSSFLSSCAPSASLSRSLVQERVGGKTQCVMASTVIVALDNLFYQCVLASIIINALRGMFLQVLDLKKLWSVSLIDFAKELPGVKIFRFEHSLFFVNTEHFRTMLYKRTINPRVLKIAQKKRQSKLAKANKRKEKEDKATKNEMTISVVDHTVKETPPDVDFHTIILDCSPWSFVDSMGGIREMFVKTRFYDTLESSSIYVSLHDAVQHALHLDTPNQI